MYYPQLKTTAPLSSNPMAKVLTTLFIIVSIWWLCIHPFDSQTVVNGKNIWSSVYWLISFFGGIFGVIIAYYWQGRKSIIGKAILAFSIGLFLQSFGQIVYNYYTLFARIEAPYPSLGDIGYFGSIFAYIYGALLLAKASGMKYSIQPFRNRLLAILLPLLMLCASYAIFLHNYQFSGSWITTMLDFGYPFGQAVYVSIALLVVYMSRNYLGGAMGKPIVLLLIALISQYISDTDFLYQANHNLWYAGSFGDYLYTISYFLMAMALVYIGHVRKTTKIE